MDQRFGKFDPWLDRLDQRFEQIESRMEQGFAMITGQLQLMTDQIQDLAGMVRGMQSRPWLPCLLIGLAFSGLYIAVIGVLLALLSKPFG